ncbi:hypothetical protein [Auritidibacter ignavus]|uniref:Uncharacterized protein n=1 Tax=Auritidibacter ignavus TaxID=678932 RepID=A0AAJ6AMD7_9MICC|nr:hypothetical protein [Auritidibacter ignavus]WGH84179.1 hypothetical protein QDX20_01110 [Auritidibacter ignavus]WGH93503.1 hypothetical protein QDX21_01420 [Auritidibacter ignavus]
MIEDLTERFEALHPHPDSEWFVETRPHAAEFYRHYLHAQEMFCELTDSSSPQYPPSADDPRALGELVQETEDASATLSEVSRASNGQGHRPHHMAGPEPPATSPQHNEPSTLAGTNPPEPRLLQRHLPHE